MSSTTYFSRTKNPTAKLDYIGNWTVFFFVVVIGVLLLLVHFYDLRCGHCCPRGFFLFALGFACLGAVAGFLYSLYGDEEKDAFQPVLTALATALGGASLADLANENGLLRRTYHELARAAGLSATSEGLVLVLAAIFSPLGFFALYFFRRLVVNRQQHREDVLESKRAALVPAGELQLDATAGAVVFHTDAASATLARDWLAQPRFGEPGYEDLVADARAHIALAQYDSAATSLLLALRLRVGSPTATFLLAAAKVALQQHAEAVDLLDTLIRDHPGQSPLNAWRLLGYARLFYDPAKPDHPQAMRLAAQASSKFLAVCPANPGALLNRACAFGQIGPADTEAQTRVFADLTQLFSLKPEARDVVKSLAAPGLDFAAWTNVPAFKLLMA